MDALSCKVPLEGSLFTFTALMLKSSGVVSMVVAVVVVVVEVSPCRLSVRSVSSLMSTLVLLHGGEEEVMAGDVDFDGDFEGGGDGDRGLGVSRSCDGD